MAKVQKQPRMGRVLKTNYVFKDGDWVQEEQGYEDNSNLEMSHWKDWAKADKGFGGKSSLVAHPFDRFNNHFGSYETISPDRKYKTVYTMADEALRSELVKDWEESMGLTPKQKTPQEQPVQFGNDLRPIKR